MSTDKKVMRTLLIKLRSVVSDMEALLEAPQKSDIEDKRLFVIKNVLDALPSKSSTPSKTRGRSGVEGVHAHPKGGWIARLGRTYVGYFSTIAEAKEAIEKERAMSR